MKRTFIIRALAVFVLSLVVCAGAGAKSATGKSLSLMDAIEQTAEKITGDLPAGSRVAIVAFESANNNLSDYIMEELTGALFDRKIEVADRQNLEYVYKELRLQMSGDVSDETAKSIGKFLAADMVITGQLLDLDGMYRYRTSAISVETAVRTSVTRLDVRSDKAARRMMAALANQKTTVKVAKYGVSADVTPQTAGTFLDRGIMFASRGEYDLAIADFTQALKLDPNMSAAYTLRGRALTASVSKVLGVGDNFSNISILATDGRATTDQTRTFDLAIADFTAALRIDPNNASTYYERGRLYNNKGDSDQAITDFNQAIRLNPNDVSAYAARGVAYSYKQEYDRAIADFNQAIRLNPNDVFSYISRGTTYCDGKQDYDRAIADFNQAIRLDPNNAIAYYGRGITYYYKQDYDRAIADFNQAIRLDPNDEVNYRVRGIAYSCKQDYDRAIVDFNQAIRLDPNNADAYYRRGDAYFWKQDYDRAIVDFNQAIRLDPNNADAKSGLEAARRQRGR